MASMHEEAEQSSSMVAGRRRRVRPARWNMAAGIAEETDRKPAAKAAAIRRRRGLAPLHLRARYVSKAAILTIPAPL